jgi:hypothetical protein
MKFIVTYKIIALCILVSGLFVSTMYGGWDCRNDHAVGIATGGGDRWNVHLTSDLKNGSILVWQDRRGGLIDKLYAQHVDASGNAEWQAGGIALSYTPGYQFYPQIIEDGNGGAIVAWQDNRTGANYNIYAQRISPNGSLMWGSSAAVVCAAAGEEYNPTLVSDGNGGAIITWEDLRSGTYAVYAQHINSSGSIVWTQDGVQVSNGSGDEIDPEITTDGAQGAIICWTDFRDSVNGPDIFAQHLGSGGQISWSSGGVPVVEFPEPQTLSQIVSDGASGAIISWDDRRTDSVDEVYLQRLNSQGIPLWQINGIPVSLSPGIQYNQRTVSDGAGGVVLVWQDNRTGSDYNIYGQRVDSTGSLLWPQAGLPICTASGDQTNPQVILDQPSILVTWQDERNGENYNVYAQRIELSGTTEWGVNGNVVYQSKEDGIAPQLTDDGDEGAIVSWSNLNDTTGIANIYSQRIGANGLPAGGCMRSFPQEVFSQIAITYHTRRGNSAEPTGGNIRDTLFSRNAFPAGITIGVVRKDSAKRYGWETFQRATNVMKALPQYGMARPFDSLDDKKFLGNITNPTVERYSNNLVGSLLALQLTIGASDVGIIPGGFGDLIYYNSNDNSCPLNHKSLRGIAGYVDSALTMWQQFRGIDYASLDSVIETLTTVYADTIDTVSASPLVIRATKPVTSYPYLLLNPSPLGSSVPATLSSEAVGDVSKAMLLLQNYPNPFNPTTIIGFTLQQQSYVTLRVYDVLGRVVETLINRAVLNEGYQYAQFDGSALSSGVYFYHLTVNPVASGVEAHLYVKKMLLVK